MLGLTRLAYHPQASGNIRAAVNSAALQIQERIGSLGPLDRGMVAGNSNRRYAAVEQEIAVLCKNAVAQGWTVKTNSATTLRFRSPRGKAFTLSKTQPDATRAELRRFAAELKAGGLRVNQSIRRPIDESPF